MRIKSSVVMLTLFLSACTSDTGSAPAGGEMPSGTTPSDSGRPTAAPPSSSSRAHVVPCTESVGSAEVPDAEFVVVADAVALPGTRMLQAQPSTEEEIGPEVLFAKAGLLVRRGHAVELLIDESQVGKAWLGWGTPAMPSSHVRVDACDQPGEWLAFAGGYWVRSAGCVRGKVSVDGGPWWEFMVPIGASCSGNK
ncbi:hypothetical protein [Micromonospora fluostatini]|uniref:hypothetical protein n=1 Tax=Micromonospora sp. JCM 30529 TaxID=3421643 RepID=UPI003D1720C7